MRALHPVVAGLALGLVMAQPALAGPFGVSFGQKIGTLAGASGAGDALYQVSPPTPDPIFSRYAVRATPEHGVCEIVAYSPRMQDRSGERVRTAYEAVRAGLTARYGPGLRMEALRPRAIWRGGRDWSVAVARGERIHATLWRPPAGRMYEDNVTSVMLEVQSEAENQTSLKLHYQGDNFTACGAAIREAQAALAGSGRR